MKKVTLLFLFFFSSLILPQNFTPGERESRPFIYSAVHFIPGSSDNTIYYTFKIPYNRLVFEKNNERYYAEYSVSVEIFDSTGNFIVRSSAGGKIQADYFDKTDSELDYTEGVIPFKIKNGTYNIIPSFSDIKSWREIKLKPVQFVTSLYSSSVIHSPLVTDAREYKTEGSSFTALSNFDENIPFSASAYNLVIPVSDTTSTGLFVNVISGKDTLFNGRVTDNYIAGISLEKQGERVVLNQGPHAVITKNFILKNFSSRLLPGNIIINVSLSGKGKPDRTFQKAVIWYNKPRSLYNTEFAIQILKYTAPDSVINEMLDESKEKYSEELFSYWKKFDPTPATAYNEIMTEYYERADYAEMNFAPIAGKKGSDTDRGKVFIVFGKPQSIMRTSNEYGKIVETWVYEKPARKFIFVDQRGTGDFSLING